MKRFLEGRLLGRTPAQPLGSAKWGCFPSPTLGRVAKRSAGKRPRAFGKNGLPLANGRSFSGSIPELASSPLQEMPKTFDEHDA